MDDIEFEERRLAELAQTDASCVVLEEIGPRPVDWHGRAVKVNTICLVYNAGLAGWWYANDWPLIVLVIPAIFAMAHLYMLARLTVD